MDEKKLGVIEGKFADIIWRMEPITTAELIIQCEQSFFWKRTTTYTVLKRLIDRGLFQNINGTVSSLISKDDFYSLQSEKFVEDTFGGSLPAFLTAFTSRKELSTKEIDQIRKIIDAKEKKND